jgi:ferredoxin
MPSLGYTTTVESVRAIAATMPPNDWLRSMCNVKAALAEDVFPNGSWDACGGEYAPAGPLHLAIDIKPDRSRACMAVCGEGAVEVIEDRAGTDWIVPRALELDRKHSFASIGIDNQGPAVSVISLLEYEGLKIRHVETGDLKSACGRFYDGVVSQQLRHRQQAVLDEAVRCAKRRTLLDAWAWTRKGTGYISPLVASTIAYWLWSENPDPPMWIM